MKVLFYISGVLLGCFLSAQTISGTVADEKGKLVPGANVYIENTLLGATTSEQGAFSFSMEGEKFPFYLLVEVQGYIPRSIWVENIDSSIKVIVKEEGKEKR